MIIKTGMKTVYLASAYSYKSRFKLINKFVMWHRFRKVTKVVARLMEKDLIVFGPITHSHSVAVIGKLPPLDHSFWLSQDKFFVDACDETYVYTMDGWKESIGVKREIDWTFEQGKTLSLVDDDGEVYFKCEDRYGLGEYLSMQSNVRSWVNTSYR